jgi:hypothetical protein
MTNWMDSTGYSRRLVKVNICLCFIRNKIFFASSANESYLRNLYYMDFVWLSEAITPNKASGYRNIKWNLRWKRQCRNDSSHDFDQCVFLQFWTAPVIVIHCFNELIGYTIIQPQEARDQSNKNEISITRHSSTKTNPLTM